MVPLHSLVLFFKRNYLFFMLMDSRALHVCGVGRSSFFISYVFFILSQMYTVDDRGEIEFYVPAAKEVKRYYNPKLFLHEDLKSELETLWAKVFASLFSVLHIFFFSHFVVRFDLINIII